MEGKRSFEETINDTNSTFSGLFLSHAVLGSSYFRSMLIFKHALFSRKYGIPYHRRKKVPAAFLVIFKNETFDVFNCEPFIAFIMSKTSLM